MYAYDKNRNLSTKISYFNFKLHIVNYFAKNSSMKKFILCLLLTFIFYLNFQPLTIISYADEMPYNLVSYTGEVKHFFTHELIYSSEKAFSKKNYLRYSFDRDHLTTTEFYNFLEEMRINNYVLIDFDMMYKIVDGKVIAKNLLLPLNKKPFTLSIDDMSYDTSNRGIINKIILDKNGEIKDFTYGENEEITSSRESITILENYLKTYPEFSINNSRICICVNGYDGVLGYRIQRDSQNREQEIEELTKVVNKLKSLGYTFACHSYSHSFVNAMSPEFIYKDLIKWKNEIEAVIGKTDIYCFPGGIHNAKGYNDYLIRDRYKILLCVGRNSHNEYEKSENFIYIYRTPLDGNSLRTYPNMYRDIFEPNKIYDNQSRFIKYYGM